MRREKLEQLVATGMIEGKQHEKMLDGLTKRPKESRVTEALKVARVTDAQDIIISPTLKSSAPD